MVGAYGKDTAAGSDAGQAYVFEYDGVTWTETAILSDGAAEARFGEAVAVDHDVNLVGAFRDDQPALQSGSATVFERRGTSWVREPRRLDPLPRFGYARAMSQPGAPMEDPQDVTRMLADLRDGDQEALPVLMETLYAEMRRLAEVHLRRERRDHTLQPTALLNEAYVRLVDQRKQDWANRSQFMAIASTAMRRVLMNHAAQRSSQKRGGGRLRVTSVDPEAAIDTPSEDLLALDDALNRLAEFDPDGAKLVEMRFFGGLKIDEVSAITGTPVRTVERRWRAVRAWLQSRLDSAAADSD